MNMKGFLDDKVEVLDRRVAMRRSEEAERRRHGRLVDGKGERSRL